MKQLHSTMAGTVFQVVAAEGEEVTVGQTIIVLESMKMEIPVDAEQAGKIMTIHAQVGDFVNEGDLLVSFE
ncbi:biotin/lipoyl-binding carrier protein [Paenisporosarcina cavernae]|uniref:Acetyl-CoA carboxylase biotin carboxyl carrier protein subunit n=1 Tax=Paenisporosarcina cavernae TaxID=2320858 RepID=A0A385YRY9_9BACL|nr:biotin/lipoyl-binding carrier protein [Paenisporosarcina cavernae]AYC29150.1 acetyl-CoA carboxylase biotin carboxyl carrier protein subunit [Paenisporosarcina cavernae]